MLVLVFVLHHLWLSLRTLVGPGACMDAFAHYSVNPSSETAEVQRLKRIIALLKTGQAVPESELAAITDVAEEGGAAGTGSPGARTPGGHSPRTPSALPEDDHAYDDGPIDRPEGLDTPS